MLRALQVVASALAAIVAAECPLPAHAGTTDVRCTAKNVIVVESDNDDDRRQACRGARDASVFLARQGMRLPQSIRIEIVSAMPEDVSDTAVGAFNRESRKIVMLSYRAYQERGRTPLGILPTNPAYRAVTAHEVAHAIAFHNFETNPTRVAQEYIAFVTMFSTMPKDMQREILRRYADYDTQWLHHPEMLYFSDPVEFGIHAYRHFRLPDNGPRFFRKVLEGDALTESE